MATDRATCPTRSTGEAGLASSAPLSEFQRSLVETANALQVSQPPRAGVISLARLVDNEHEGAVHVRDLAARLFDR